MRQGDTTLSYRPCDIFNYCVSDVVSIRDAVFSNAQRCDARFQSAVALHGLWRFVSESLFTPPDQNFALRHASIIHAALTPQGNRYRVTFRVFRVTGL